MIKNYFKIAFRNILRNRFFYSINIFGLAVGIACCIVISLYILHELSYDKFHSDVDRMYRVKYELDLAGVLYKEASIPFPSAEAFKNDFPEVENAVRIYKNVEFPLVEFGDKKFSEENFFFADENIFELFDFTFINGNPASALSEPDNVVITKAAAEKYFENENPIGRLIEYNNSSSFKVTAVLQNVPANSHFKFDFIASLDFQLNRWESLTGSEGREKKWFWTGAWTYLLLNNNAAEQSVTDKLPAFVNKYFPDKIKGGIKLDLQKLTDIHLYSNLDNEIAPTSSITNIYIFSAVAFFILIIACINYINLSTAQSFKRIKEIGMRKIMGAVRIHLIGQILSETIIVTFFSVLISIVFIELFISFFSSLFGVHLSMNISDGDALLVFAGLILLVGILAGLYPALFISRFNPLLVIKRTISFSAGKDVFRKTLVVAQFAISISLMICIGIIQQQLDYVKNKKIGIDKENIIFIKARPEVNQKYNAFREELMKLSSIRDVSSSSNIPGKEIYASRFIPEGYSAENPLMLPILSVDENFINALSIQLKEGRSFSKLYPSDTSKGFIINEAAAKMLAWENPLGKTMQLYAPGTQQIMKSGEVVGVVKDFNFESLHHEVKPLILINENLNDYIAVKLNISNLDEQISHIKNIWSQFSPEWPLEYVFLDKNIEQTYTGENKLEQIISYFTLIAFILACLGLFGLAGFTTVQKTKEIGVHKVLGASSSGVVFMLSKSFLKLVFISFIPAIPISYLLMDKWLQNFAFHITPGFDVYLFAIGAAVLISLVTISYHAVKAALADPVKSLKYE